MRIAILQTDHVLDQFQAEFGDYPAMFKAVLGSGSRSIEFVSYDVQVAVPATVDCDAYLITGSRHSVYDDLPWIAELVDFLGQVLAKDRKILGICFGHQLIAHFFGGEVGPADGGWAVGVHASQVICEKAWMSGSRREIRLISSHKDQVRRIPENAEIFATNAFCPVAGFTMADKVWTIQGHPEFLPDYSSALMRFRREIIGESVYQSGVESLSEPLDAMTVAEWMLNFVEQ
jgi:GMP synthase-like glutamine amidotransferase